MCRSDTGQAVATEKTPSSEAATRPRELLRITGAAPSPSSAPTVSPSLPSRRSLFLVQERPDAQWPVARALRSAGRGPTQERQKPAAASAPRPMARDRSLPGSACLHSGPAPSPSPGTPRFRSAALPSPPAPSGPRGPPLSPSGSLAACLGGCHSRPCLFSRGWCEHSVQSIHIE